MTILRAPLTASLAVTGGVPRLRAPLTLTEVVSGGQPQLRAALIVVQAVIPIPEPSPVATLVFPALRGQTYPVKKTAEFNTGVRRVTSGRRAATAFRQFPIWRFELSFDYLPDKNPGSAGYTDYRTLQSFFLQMQGQFGLFLYRDTDDFRIVGGQVATADGVTPQWPFIRQFNGAVFTEAGAVSPGQAEPVGQVDRSFLLSFPASAVNTTTGQINIAGHGLATGQSPPLFVANTGGSLPTGLAANTPYWPIVTDPNHIQLAATQPNALANANLSLSAAGSGVNTLSKGFAIYETIAEIDSVPGSGPFMVVVANAAAFVADAGVTIGGAPLTKVASAPAANQYSVNAQTGVYTFNAAQASASAAITYAWLANPARCALAPPNQLVFASAPSAGAIITADFDFWFQCAFSDDKVDFEKFMNLLWELEKLEFESVIP